MANVLRLVAVFSAGNRNSIALMNRVVWEPMKIRADVHTMAINFPHYPVVCRSYCVANSCEHLGFACESVDDVHVIWTTWQVSSDTKHSRFAKIQWVPAVVRATIMVFDARPSHFVRTVSKIGYTNSLDKTVALSVRHRCHPNLVSLDIVRLHQVFWQYSERL